MNILVIEDERLAAEKLIGFIMRYFPDANIVGALDKVSQVIEYFSEERSLDLIFSDIELLDGQVFSALNDLDLPCPVVYTTSYNQYWMDAFKNQGIEYLMKPFSYKRFAEAMIGYEQLKNSLAKSSNHQTNPVKVEYKSRFLLKKNQQVEILQVEDIVCVRAASGVLSAYDKAGNHHMLTINSMTELETQLDPNLFFRLNRSDLVNLNFIQSYELYGKETLAVTLSTISEPLLTSKTRTSQFKKWLDR